MTDNGASLSTMQWVASRVPVSVHSLTHGEKEMTGSQSPPVDPTCPLHIRLQVWAGIPHPEPRVHLHTDL